MPYEGEFLGFLKADNPEKVIAKWGKPSKEYECATRGYKNEIFKYKFLIYQREEGEIKLQFASYGGEKGNPYELQSISFHKVNPNLPKGIRMGMRKEGVERVLGKPDFSTAWKDVRILPLLIAFSFLFGSFWTAFLVDFIPRGKKRAHKVILLLMSSFISIVIFLFCRVSILIFEEFLREGNLTKISSSLPVPSEDIFVKLLLPFLGFLLIPSLLLGGLFTWLEYGPHIKPIWRISVIVLIAVLFSFLLAFPTRLFTLSIYPAPFKVNLYLAFKSTLLPMLRLSSYPLLIAIWFFALRSNQKEI
mgnify:CR=1 FL=1